MRKKNLFLVMLAMVLVCAISVTGTLAYLTDKTDVVKNTFIAAGGGSIAKDIKLTEHVATDDDKDGIYTLGTTTTESNSYNVLPNVDLVKDPFVTIEGKTSAPAYLFVEVVDGLGTNSGLSYTVDSTNWEELSGVTGQNGGKVYVYKGQYSLNKVITDDEWTDDANVVYILTDNKIEVAETISVSSEISLEFYAYLAQSTVAGTNANTSDPATVYTTCFPEQATNP